MIDKGYYVINCGTYLNDVGYWNGVNWLVMFYDHIPEDDEVEIIRKIDMGS